MTQPHRKTDPRRPVSLMALEMTLIAIREGDAGLLRWLEERELMRQAVRGRLAHPHARA